MTTTTTTRTRRFGKDSSGCSLYSVEQLRPAPTFNRGDGYDGGRNLLGALLIGPSWDTVGYIVGKRGSWRPYRSLTRRATAVSNPQATVAQAAAVLTEGAS